MPSTYAHCRFGKEVFVSLPETLREQIAAHMDLFMIGLHGPDILFYYRPVGRNRVNRLGSALHRQSGVEFFSNAAEILKQHDSEEYLVYVYGVLCHYALDRSCHLYVNQYMAASGISHGEIEVEFDRRLLVHDGYNPLEQCLTSHFHPSREAAEVIANFYEPLSVNKVYECLRSFVFYLDLLVAPNRGKRAVLTVLLNTAEKIGGFHGGVHGLVVNEKPNPECTESNRMLAKLYKRGVKDAVELIGEFTDTIEGKTAWNSKYEKNFEGE